MTILTNRAVASKCLQYPTSRARKYQGVVLSQVDHSSDSILDIQSNNIPSASVDAVRRTGVAVIRGVMPKDSTEALLSDIRGYFSNHAFKGFLPMWMVEVWRGGKIKPTITSIASFSKESGRSIIHGILQVSLMLI
ncbi:hypothetical protein QWA68_013726 [Fusarium oxysporum]|nr:hypothetical protein QWA68_013726 [Fusarium oxysporum]